jgi:hypothetical protein
MVRITEDLLSRGRSAAGGWTRAQLELIGVPWPPVAGWKVTVLGGDLTDAEAASFIAGKGAPRPPAGGALANPAESGE